MPLKLEKTKGKNYYVSGTVGGVRIRKSTGTTRRDLADALRIRWESELENRRIYGPTATATFAEALNHYLDRGGEGRFLLPLVDHFTDRKLADIDQAALDMAAQRLMPKAKPSTLNRQIYTPFIAVMTAAAKAGLTHARHFERPRGHRKRTRFRFLWPDEYESVWQAAPPHGRIALDILVGTGMREAEALSLTFEDLSPDFREAWVWESKTDHPRRIELPTRATLAIERALHRSGPVILNGGGAPYTLSPSGGGALKTSLHTWAKDANVEPFGAHVMRHTFATWFYAMTRDIIALKAQGGWKSSEAERYAHLAPRSIVDDLRNNLWTFDQISQNHHHDWRNSDEHLTPKQKQAIRTIA